MLPKRIFFIIVSLLSQSYAPIMTMQKLQKETTSAKLEVQNNSSKLVALNAVHPTLQRCIMQHIYPNNKNSLKALLDEKLLESADIWTHAGIFTAAIEGKYNRYSDLISADAVIRKFETAEPGQPDGIKITKLWLRDIPGTGSKIIATVGQDGLISLALAPTTP